MPLRDQPYLPLYIQDVLTDEKLIECSAEAHGVYFLLLCILHKQEKYGLLCLKQKYKQTDNQINCFASMLVKQMPFTAETISKALSELVYEKVLILDGDNLYQKRMLKDGELSIIRTEVGKKGGSSVTKQYGKKGFLYLMSDGFDRHKIGISVNPKNRLYRLRSDLSLPKNFEIIEQVSVLDMGKAEDFAHEFFGEKMNGEWINESFDWVHKSFVLLQAKFKAKIEANNEIEYENEIEDKTDKKKKDETEKELNDVEVGKTIEYMKFTAQRKMTADQVLTYWKAFLIHSEGEFHRNRNDKLQHFRNWLKKQPNETTKRTTDTAAPGTELSPI